MRTRPSRFANKDKDGDQVTAFAKIDEGEFFVTALICSNAYNASKDAHGTFSYAQNVGEKYAIVLESNLLTRGGVSEDNLKYFMRTFISHIDRWEGIILSAIKELGPDSNFLKTSGVFLETLSTIAKGVGLGLLESLAR